MPAKPHLVPPAPAFVRLEPSPAAESSPAGSKPVPLAPEPFWPRLWRAVLLLSLAVSLHIWAVPAPEPQEPVYSLLASRVISSVLSAPPVPLAPPLQTIQKHRSAERVVLQTTVVNVLPYAPVSFRSAVDRAVIPAGMVGAMGRSAPDEARLRMTPIPTVGEAPSASGAMVDSLVDDRSPATVPLSIATSPAPSSTPPEHPLLSLDRVVGTTAERGLAAPATAVEEERRQKEVVLAVVHQYARALERLDVGAAKAVYPTLDGRELRRAFEGLKGQQYHIASCGVLFSPSGDDAHAKCTGNATFRPKVGSRVVRIPDYEWVISLARGGGGWQILEARIHQ